MDDNTQYLKELAELEKKNKQIELDQARAEALLKIEREKEKTMPTFTQAKQQASVASQIGAKNLAEFWARRGQTNQGISAQAELSRQNVLARELGSIGQQEQQALTDYSNQALDVGTGYQNKLASAYGDIDANLAGNLYNERLRQQQQAYEREQDRIANAQRWATINASKTPTEIEGSIKVINNKPYVFLNGKWQEQK